MALQYDIDLDLIFEPHHYNEITKFKAIRSVINQANNYFKYIIHNIPLPSKNALTTEERLEIVEKRLDIVENLLFKTSQKNVKNNDNKNIQEYINETKKKKEEVYSKAYIVDDSDDLGKLRNIIFSIKDLYFIQIDFIKIKRVFPEHIKIINEKFIYVVGFLNLDGNTFISRIKNFNSEVIKDKKTQFRLFRDQSSNRIRSKKSIEEIEKLKNSPNGNFLIMQKEERVIFETFYEIITAYENKDINFKLTDIMETLMNVFPNFWLTKFLKS